MAVTERTGAGAAEKGIMDPDSEPEKPSIRPEKVREILKDRRELGSDVLWKHGPSLSFGDLNDAEVAAVVDPNIPLPGQKTEASKVEARKPHSLGQALSRIIPFGHKKVA